MATLPSGSAATVTGSRDTGEASGDPAREGEASGAEAGPGGGDGGTEATGGGASWTERIEANAFSELIRSSRWGYPVIEIAHLLGLAILVGAAALFDARLLGFWRGLPITEGGAVPADSGMDGFRSGRRYRPIDVRHGCYRVDVQPGLQVEAGRLSPSPG